MKALKSTLFSIFMISLFVSCNAQNPDNAKSETVAGNDIEIYYFHFTKRCLTCNAVESETKLALATNYEEEMDEGVIAFSSLNLDEEEGKKIAEDLKVSGQTLLLVKGDKHVNLTNDGFMNARTNPEKFHTILKEQLDKLL